MGSVIGAIAIGAALLLAVFAVLNGQRGSLGDVMRMIGGIVILALAVIMAVTGRFLPALPLAFLGLLLLVRKQPLGSGSFGDPAGGRVSSVRTAFLEMTLQHDTGEMKGQVLAGVYAGRELSSLAEAELLVLWRECRAADPPSRQLLEAYLDRMAPDWRDRLKRMEREETGAAQEPRGSGPMAREEALAVLGLERGASEDEIRAAHRNLMKRFHPDQGGSTYLAAKINAAKETLLGK